MHDLTGKTALVTGASSGIGQETAKKLARSGSNLILHYHANEAGIQQTAQAVDETGVDYLVTRCDFQDGNLDNFCQQVWDWKNGLELVVNVAGGDILTNEKKNWTFERKLDFLWKLDVHSTLFLSRNFGHRMKQQGVERQAGQTKPSIVTIGWDQAPLGQAGENGQIFSTIKGAVMAFTQSLAKSLAPDVRVNCVAPGWIRTAWGDSTSEYWNSRAQRESLLGRWGHADDVAHAICWLASNESEFINGQVIQVNGGLGFGKE